MIEAKTEMVRARLAPEMKEAAEAVFAKLGLGHTEAIRMFYQQVIFNNGLPFDVKIPNSDTLEAIAQHKAHKGITRYKTTKQLFDKYR